ERADLPILTPEQARRYLAAVREITLAVLDWVDLDDRDPMLVNGFIFANIIQHEQQHRETMLATLQVREEPYPLPDPADLSPAPAGGAEAGSEVAIDGGVFRMGLDEGAWIYDNERPSHEVEVAPFRIDMFPVTNREFAEFIGDGGYDDE